MPGRSLLAMLTAANPLPTLYTRIGNVFGWLCVAAAILLFALSRAPEKTQPMKIGLIFGFGPGIGSIEAPGRHCVA
jgi:hypothetical protein